jgi:hypothetical protein
VEVEDIMSHHDVVTADRASLLEGMNYGVREDYSAFMMCA